MSSPRENLQYGHQKRQQGRRNEFRSERRWRSNPSRSRSRSRSRSQEHERQRRQLRETKRYEDRSGSPVSRERDNRWGPQNPSSLSRKANNVDRSQWRNRSKGLEGNEVGDIDDIDEQKEPLPVAMFKDELIKAVKASQVLVCTGETGSGKTTQIPQYLLELLRERDRDGTTGHTESDKAGLYKNAKSSDCRKLMVAVTQPRRVAATSVARRVADERGCRVGEEVGYSIRFEDRTGPRTRIKYMTDGVLVRECLEDPQLSRYGVVMLDEAHERSIDTDILFGLLKRALARRPDLHSVITSATLDVERFTAFFNGCPSLSIPGRTHAVDVYHSKTRQVKAMGLVG